MKKNIILTIGTLLFSANVNSQSITNLQKLKIGEKVPDVRIDRLINSQSKTSKISDYKGKILILDFWSTWCSACLDEMPHAVELQRRFPDKIKIIAVTNQKENVINAFLKTHKQIAGLKLAMSLEDVELSKLFPNKLLPHIVWINPDGIYLGATSQTDLNAKNIDKIWATGAADFSEYKNDDIQFDSGKPLFVNGNGELPIYEYKSLLTYYQPGLPTSIGTKKENNNIRIHATNVTLAMLIRHSLGLNSLQFPQNRFLVTPSDLEKKVFPDSNVSKSQKMFCYELIRKDTSRLGAYKHMLNDIESFFHIKVTTEQRSVKCLTLVVNGNNKRLLTTDNINENNLHDPTVSDKILRGGSVYDFIYYLNNNENLPPIIDETNISGLINLHFHSDFKSLNALNSELFPYGLTLKEAERNLKMITIKKADNDF
ncbi:Thiol-disulfide isomerase or thioredoxin [Mucilaginibacter pineti]|uniref:Thiol-disulfide isomerase or thioredoxin n=1 Tax=Mucilaginibacter pineti TaxID=1391627 RepID=A0A1G7H3K9_9SPHI|nr:TlpA family protein disulfide reductase [Mucilaginibacter pineti]SDE95020.1 Thiol-disulfide isomerase or thioredoxin [Mucilaginibacter pineti]